jgi:phospholipid-binding lipoprotein MlaA
MRSSIMQVLSRLCALLGVLALAACATAPDPSDREAYAEYEARNDPLEPFNRGVYQVNRYLDALILKPAAGWYRLLTPPPVQTAIGNALDNLRSPAVFANDLMQGEWERAGDTGSRFLINSTLGVGGLGDPAADWFGIEEHGEDFGQTLAVWGVDEGPYLFLPLLGPSNPRDAAGRGVDGFLLDPIGVLSWSQGGIWTLVSRTKTGATAVDARAENFDALEDIEKNSLDPYASLRNLYRQFRRREIYHHGGGAGGSPDIPSYDDIPDIPDIPAPDGDLGSEPGPAAAVGVDLPDIPDAEPAPGGTEPAR